MALPDLGFAVADGLIVEVLGGTVPESGREFSALAGFIDIHNHGAVGHDVNSTTVDDLLKVAAYLAGNGVTSWVPTLVPDSDENYRQVIDTLDELMVKQVGKPIAQAVGVHYEGVFANHAMCGALRAEYFKRYSGREIDELPRLRSGVHMITLAPEIEGGIELIRDLVERGWIVSIGHTAAGPDVLDKALEADTRLITDFGNAMGGVHHRSVGAVGWGLTNDDVTFDIIADGVHVDPRVVAMACRAKGVDKVSMISDSVAPTGLGDGEFELWGGKISVIDGRTRNAKGAIAGSVSTMLEGARLLRELGFGDDEIEKMTSLNAARLLGLDGDRGSLEVGKRADVVGLDRKGNIAFTMIGGQMVGE